MVNKYLEKTFQITTLVAVALALLLSSTVSKAMEENPNQLVVDGILVSSDEPALAIKVDEKFKYVGRHPIRIRDVAAGERFIFTQANGTSIEKLFIVQFEGFLDGIDNHYRYDLSKQPVIAGYPFRSNGYAFNIIEAIAENPGGESAATRPFLQSKGYSVPDELTMWRSLTVVDEARKKEVIIYYLEDLKTTNLSLAQLYKNDQATAEWMEIQKELEVRANESFQLTTVNDAGEPKLSEWESIPNRFGK